MYSAEESIRSGANGEASGVPFRGPIRPGFVCLCAMLIAQIPLCLHSAHAQGMMSDLMSGALVKPEVGAFAWYNLKDTATGQEFFLRQAIVGEERIKRKTAYWLETELIPRIGYPSVYKMLLTGPASDPDNVHRLLVREGTNAVQEIRLDDGERGGADPELTRELVGTETIPLPAEEIETEHFLVGEGEDATDLWVSEKVAPMGLVKMVTKSGELVLQRYGVGGKDGESAIPMPSTGSEEDAPTARENEENSERVQRNFSAGRRGKR